MVTRQFSRHKVVLDHIEFIRTVYVDRVEISYMLYFLAENGKLEQCWVIDEFKNLVLGQLGFFDALLSAEIIKQEINYQVDCDLFIEDQELRRLIKIFLEGRIGKEFISVALPTKNHLGQDDFIYEHYTEKELAKADQL